MCWAGSELFSSYIMHSSCCFPQGSCQWVKMAPDMAQEDCFYYSFITLNCKIHLVSTAVWQGSATLLLLMIRLKKQWDLPSYHWIHFLRSQWSLLPPEHWWHSSGISVYPGITVPCLLIPHVQGSPGALLLSSCPLLFSEVVPSLVFLGEYFSNLLNYPHPILLSWSRLLYSLIYF